MVKDSVFIIDNDPAVVELVRDNLGKIGIQVSTVLASENPLRTIRREQPKLILLDLMLPGLEGIALCQVIRQDPDLAATPIMMLCELGSSKAVVAGLEAGADDFIVKPLIPDVLLTRIEALLQRKQKNVRNHADVISINDITIHVGRHEVLVGQQRIELTVTEFDLLHYLASHPGWAFPRQQLIEATKGKGSPITSRAVDVQIAGLRKKLAGKSHLIETVHGVGYRFAPS